MCYFELAHDRDVEMRVTANNPTIPSIKKMPPTKPVFDFGMSAIANPVDAKEDKKIRDRISDEIEIIVSVVVEIFSSESFGVLMFLLDRISL